MKAYPSVRILFVINAICFLVIANQMAPVKCSAPMKGPPLFWSTAPEGPPLQLSSINTPSHSHIHTLYTHTLACRHTLMKSKLSKLRKRPLIWGENRPHYGAVWQQCAVVLSQRRTVYFFMLYEFIVPFNCNIVLQRKRFLVKEEWKNTPTACQWFYVGLALALLCLLWAAVTIMRATQPSAQYGTCY